MTTQVQPLANATQLVARKAGELDVLSPLLGTDYVVVTRDGVKLYRGQISGLVSALGLGTAAMLVADTDPGLSANSDSRLASQAAIRSYIAAQISTLINSAPGALDTLNELAAALGNDANFSATVTAALAGKQAASAQLSALSALSGTTFGRSLITLADAAALRAAAGMASGTWVQMQAATGMTIGARWWCTDVGISGSEWVYNGTVWVPVAGMVTLRRHIGSIASPVSSVTGTTAETVFSLPGGNVLIPAGLLSVCPVLTCDTWVYFTGANGTRTLRNRVGTANSTTDPNFGGLGGLAATNNLMRRGFAQMVFSASNRAFESQYLAPHNSGSMSAPTDYSTNLNTAADMYTQASAQLASAADAAMLLFYRATVSM